MLRLPLTEEFEARIASFAAGFLSFEETDRLLSLLQNEAASVYLPNSALANLLRIIESAWSRSRFLKDFISFPFRLHLCCGIAAHSNYLTDIIVRHPELLSRLFEYSFQEPMSEDQLEQNVSESLSRLKTTDAKLHALQTIKQRELLSIGTADISGNQPLYEITAELAALARVLSTACLKIACDELKQKSLLHSNDEPNYCLIALGKMGGNELNYSSDIDMILLFDAERCDDPLLVREILSSAALTFIRLMTSVTSNSFLYRVDFRLRPDGKTSPLCGSLQEYIRYYETRGEDWERQMLVKAGFTAGSRALFERFLKSLSPFIYPASFAVSPVEQLRRLRKTRLAQYDAQLDIKQSAGGIRDIEFSVQALQLLNGGKDKEIRGANTLDAIRALAGKGLLSSEESSLLTEAYSFFRKIEHYLQLMNNRQTHSIPENGELLSQLASYLSFEQPQLLLEAVQNYQRRVAYVYNEITGSENNTPITAEKSLVYKDAKRAEKNFRFLRSGTGVIEQKQFDSRTIELFERIEEPLRNMLNDSILPDAALHNLVRILQSAPIVSQWYAGMQNAAVLRALVKICGESQCAVDLCSEDAMLKDAFLSGIAFDPIDINFADAYPPKLFLFVLSVQYALKLITHTEASLFLTDYLVFFFRKTVLSFEKKHPEYTYFLAALGSFGAGEPKLFSDLDIIIVIDSLAGKPEAQQDFTGLLTRLRESLAPFSVDCRLRPEGKSSVLVWDIEGYAHYLRTRAQTWEFQALLKFRHVSGSEALVNQFLQIVIETQKERKNNSSRDIIEMRRKLYPGLPQRGFSNFHVKRSRGGLADIEFSLHAFIFRNQGMYSDAIGKSTTALIELLRQNELLSVQESSRMSELFLFLKQIDFALMSVLHNTRNVLPGEPEKQLLLARTLGFTSVSEMHSILKSNTDEIHALFTKYVLDYGEKN